MRVLGGRYRLEQCIGVGGMSEVWRGYDEVLARPVAVKLLAPHEPTGPDAEERARTEARAAAQLVHPNVAGVFDFGMAAVAPDRQAPYIVMELVDGATLAEHLAAGPMDWDIAVRICAEISAALAAAHGHDIVHRDIKPANIMLTPSGAKVLDFGIATATGQCDPQPAGTVLGTPAYLAPERIGGRPATPATDMYSVGVLLYECLTGRLPWPRRTPTQLLEASHHTPPAPLPPIDGLAPEAAELCRSCLNEGPEERPTSLVAALVLAEAVDARVYVPPVGLPAPPRPPVASGGSAGSGEHIGRHRAGPHPAEDRSPAVDRSSPGDWRWHPTEASRPGGGRR
ncbi:serine/threonine-protein kinase [Planosporangium sp. 12N6]|uniref:serine/threonine-protein kinase n=1 Tax=Planosporangium spinosum TaxID=3402278 RepID=UPI003CEFE7E5